MTSTRRRIAGALGIVTILAAIIPAFSGVDEPVALHHLDHSGLVLLGAVTALLMYEPGPESKRRADNPWIFPTVLAPVAIMLAMWPSIYDFLDVHHGLHALEHLVLAALGFVTAYSGQRYMRGVGTVVGLLTFVMAAISAGGYGVIKP